MGYIARSIVVFISLAVLAGSCKVEPKPQIMSANFQWVELAEGVYSCIHKFGGKAICNVGVVDNGHETIIFDSFLSPEVAIEMVEAVREMGLSPVKYVVNSHFHNDHIRGNQVFPQEVRIISTTKTKDLIEEEEPLQIAFEKENAPARLSYYDSLYRTFDGDTLSRQYKQILMWRPYYETLSNSHSEVKTRLPDLYVDSIKNFDGPNRRIQLISKGPGHTDSDLVMYLPDDDILFTGDLIFNACHPYVAHGNVQKWKAWLDYMNTLNVITVMPGHGQIGSEDLIDQMKEYLMDLELSAQELIDNEGSIDSVNVNHIPERYKEWWFDRFYVYNLGFVYETLQKENVK